MEEEIHLQGIAVCEGIAFGRIVFEVDTKSDSIPEFAISDSEVGGEIGRYRKAISSSKEDLQNLQKFFAKEGADEAVSIIDTHIQMLEDPIITTEMEEKIGLRLQNTESVFRSVMGEYEQRFIKMESDFFKQRLIDVKDLSSRILKHLNPPAKKSKKAQKSVLCVDELTPSTVAEANNEVLAFISRAGGGHTSHAALIARSKGIPYVASIDLMKLGHMDGTQVIVDGYKGKVIVNPTCQTLKFYEELDRSAVIFSEQSSLPCYTKDGHEIQMWANVEGMDDFSLLHKHGVSGIGLVRSEFLCSAGGVEKFSEAKQCKVYAEMLKQAKGLPVVFRLFDLGNDKPSGIEPDFSLNPALGCRSIRFLLKNRTILKRQIRSLLKVSSLGELKILLPLVTEVGELLQVKKIIDNERQQLKEKGIIVADQIDVGCMIEVPSAAMVMDLFTPECKFFSIGTNDLIQYTLAVDRSDPSANSIYQSTNPGVLRLIQLIVSRAEFANLPVTLCGEMASNPMFTALLIGLGLRKFSCSPRFIPAVKDSVKKISAAKAKELAELVLELPTSEQIYDLLKRFD